MHFRLLFGSRVAEYIADVMSPLLFFLLLSYSIIIAVFLFNVEALDELNFVVFGILTALSQLVMQLVIYSRLSEYITEDLSATGDLFYESPWYRLSPKQQKLYILPILRSQREFRLMGLGIIECSLRICAAVIFSASILKMFQPNATNR